MVVVASKDVVSAAAAVVVVVGFVLGGVARVVVVVDVMATLQPLLSSVPVACDVSTLTKLLRIVWQAAALFSNLAGKITCLGSSPVDNSKAM